MNIVLYIAEARIVNYSLIFVSYLAAVLVADDLRKEMAADRAGLLKKIHIANSKQLGLGFAEFS